MRYFIIAGEASGDLQGAQLMRQIRLKDPAASFRGIGGDLMAAEGAILFRHYRDLAFMGLFAVLSNIRTICRTLRMARQQIRKDPPDVLILIDYGAFNLRMARFAKKLGQKVFYFISPKVWAWNTARVKTIRDCVDRMFVILPFEVEFYARHQYRVDYVGNPLVDKVTEEKPRLPSRAEFHTLHGLDERPVIAVLPGSRVQEVKAMLPVMAQMASSFPGYQFLVAATATLDPALYRQLTGNHDLRIVTGQTYAILRHAEAALVTSGTATLETALFGVPQVVCYRTSTLTYMLGKPLVNIRYISLVNLIMDREVVTELIQSDFNAGRLKYELEELIEDSENRQRILEEYRELEAVLGQPGASARLADLMIGDLQEPTTGKGTE